MIDVFDLKTLDDIPETLKQELQVCKVSGTEAKYVELFEYAGRALDLDEIQVGLFRKFRISVSRKELMTKLYNMSRARHPHICKVDGRRAVYELAQKSPAPEGSEK